MAVDAAIRKAIGNREGVWKVSLAEVADQEHWKLMVKGPNGCHWTQKFQHNECSPSQVGAAVLTNLEQADAELSIALADLVKEGVMFVRNIHDDGSVEYVIDRVRLTGDEVKYLRQHGALTRRGIQQYLTARK
ncbi:MAG TPA: hypothetical protein VKY31_15710 [Terriglobia bacterium]|nr:hypothetical protein [Terriglobia bacterium]